MSTITDVDKELFRKIDAVLRKRPSSEEAVDFWLGLSAEEYDRLVFLFENNKIEGMSSEVRLKLVKAFKRLKERLGSKNKKAKEH